MTEEDFARIETIVRSIVSESRTGAFRDRVGGFTRTIYANRQYPDCLWYFWNGGLGPNGAHEPITQPVLTGRISNVQIVEKQYKGNPDDKLQIELETIDGTFNIESGFETVVARGWMTALLELNPKVGDLISLEVRPGDQEEKALLGTLYDANEKRVFKPYAKDTNWSTVADRLIALFPRGRYYSLAQQAEDKRAKEEGRSMTTEDRSTPAPATKQTSPWDPLKAQYGRAAVIEVLWELFGVESPNNIPKEDRSQALEAVTNALKTRPDFDDIPF